MDDAFGLLCNCGVPVFFILLGLVVGGARERSHLRQLARREEALADMLVTNIKTFPGGIDESRGAALVMGEAVIATDYLKTFFAQFRKLVGGELRSYQTLMDRARREATLRMMEDAEARGYNAVCNLRLGCADIGGMTGAKGAAMVEVFATGTAYARPAATDPAEASPGRLAKG